MIYTETEAKKTIIDAGRQLIQAGLIARTWGNISARISETHMAITPSGRAYETLSPEDIVVVDLRDGTYAGDIKPSSEKGIHSDVYRLRRDVGFVIHTHQTKASAVSVMGEDLRGYPEEYSALLGPVVPCAAYGISSTKSLRKAVESAVQGHLEAKAFLMRSHGALCLGSDFSEAFSVSSALEAVCEREIESMVRKVGGLATYSEDARRNLYLIRCGKNPIREKDVPDWGTSSRESDTITLDRGGRRDQYNVSANLSDLPEAAALHLGIYRKFPEIHHIIHLTDPDTLAVSATGKTLIPSLDDLAQIAGTRIRCGTVKNAVRDLRGRNAVLIEGAGALCTGTNADEAMAVCVVLHKGCEAEIDGCLAGIPHRLGWFDTWLQRTFYVLKYSKLKNAKRKGEKC